MGDETINQSDFGKGFTYCIGLFLAHGEPTSQKYCFYCATDHLQELKIPDHFTFATECRLWRDKCFEWRFSECTKDDIKWAVKQAKRFLLEWDKQNGIECAESRWK